MSLDIQTVEDHLCKLKEFYHREVGKLKQLESNKEEKEQEIHRLQEERKEIELKRTLLYEASEEARKQAKETLQSIATNALQFIMGDHISLEIELSEKGNNSTASFVVKKKYGDYVVTADPAEEEGGGIADIVAFSIFIAMLQLSGSNNSAPLFLDEPSKYVSKGHSDRVAQFLYDVSRSIERQVFMVTHDEFLANTGDASFHFRIEDGKTVSTKIV